MGLELRMRAGLNKGGNASEMTSAIAELVKRYHRFDPVDGRAGVNISQFDCFTRFIPRSPTASLLTL